MRSSIIKVSSLYTIFLFINCVVEGEYQPYDCKFGYEKDFTDARSEVAYVNLFRYNCGDVLQYDYNNYSVVNIQEFEMRPSYEFEITAYNPMTNTREYVDDFATHCLAEIEYGVVVDRFDFTTINDFGEGIMAGDTINHLMRIRIDGDCSNNPQYVLSNDYFQNSPFGTYDLLEYFSLTEAPTLTDTLEIRMILTMADGSTVSGFHTPVIVE